MPVQHVGGSFAPPLTDELLTRYAAVATQAEPQVADALNALLKCVRAWWELPESTAAGSPHPSGRGMIVELEKGVASSLWPLIPWGHEIAAIQGLFDKLPSDTDAQKALRNAAFHLLWHVIELDKDREPITNDKV